MQAGYDNLWMYQNNRPKPVLVLSNNDNYSNPIPSDSYRPMQNKECTSHLKNYLTSHSNTAASYQFNQYRATTPQCMWPSSVYSMPYRSSYANNFQTQDVFPTHHNDVDYLSQNSQSQQSLAKNTNVNFAQECNNLNNSNGTSVLTQHSDNSKTQVPRIRVKDVFSLNNNVINNTLMKNGLSQNHQTIQNKYPLNYATVNHNKTCNSEIRAEYVDFQQVNEPTSNHLPPYYEQTASELPCMVQHQHYLQNFGSFYQRSAEISSEKQLQVNNTQGIEGNLNSESLTMNSQATKAALTNKKTQKAQSGQNKNIELPGNKRVKIKPKRSLIDNNNLQYSKQISSLLIPQGTNNFNLSELLTVDKNVVCNTSDSNTVHGQCMAYLQKKDNATALNHTSPCEELKKRRNSVQCADSKSLNLTNNQENDLIQITVSYSDQRDYFNSDESQKSPCSSLPRLSELNGKVKPLQNVINSQDSTGAKSTLPQTSQGDAENCIVTSSGNHVGVFPHSTQSIRNSGVTLNFDFSNHKNLDSPSRNSTSFEQGLLPKKSQFDLNAQETQKTVSNTKSSEKNTLEKFNSVIKNSEENITTQAIRNNENYSDGLEIKQEIFPPVTASFNTQANQELPKEKTFNQIIKTEKTHEVFTIRTCKTEEEEEKSSDSSNSFDALSLDNIAAVDKNAVNVEKPIVDSEKPEPKSKTLVDAVEYTQSDLQDLEVSKKVCIKEDNKFMSKSEFEGSKEKNQKAIVSCDNVLKASYKSEINRNKLNLLIQFLEKEDLTYTSKKEDQSSEEQSKRSRRKLNKNFVVKNKNNAREMVSLMSLKRNEISSSQSPDPADKNFEKIEETKINFVQNASVETTDVIQLFENSENQQNSEESFPNKLGKSKPKEDDSIGKEFQKTSTKGINDEKSVKLDEKNILNIMQALQSLKNHFCMSCNLISSIDSFWINVFSGELRCLNCFKKMSFKAEENSLKSKIPYPNNCSDSKGNSFLEEKSITLSGNKKESTTKLSTERGLIVEENSKTAEVDLVCESLNDFKNIKEEIEEKMVVNSTGSEIENSDDLLEKVTKEDNFSPKIRPSHEQKNVNAEEIGDNLRKDQFIDCVGFKTSVLENIVRKEIKKFYENSLRKSPTREVVVDNDSNEKTSPVRKKSISKENCAPTVKLPLNSPVQPSIVFEKNESKEKKMLKESPCKFSSSEEYVSTKTKISEEYIAQETHNKREKSTRKSLSKEGKFFEELSRKEKKNLSTQHRRRSNSKDEYCAKKAPIFEEETRKEASQFDELLLEQAVLKKNFSLCKTQFEEKISRKSLKQESSNNLQIQSSANKKLKMTEETNLAEETKKRKMSSDMFESVKTNDSLIQPKKRKNLNEDLCIHKVRSVEEYGKEIKQQKQMKKNEELVYKHEKEHGKHSVEKYRRSSSSKEDSVVAEEDSKKETATSLNSLRKLKTKNDFKEDIECPKLKPEHSKQKASDTPGFPRRKSREDGIPLKPSKDHLSDGRKPFESSDKLRRNSITKDALLSPKSDVIENQEKKIFKGKIPKMSYNTSESDIRDIIRSSLNSDQSRRPNMTLIDYDKTKMNKNNDRKINNGDSDEDDKAEEIRERVEERKNRTEMSRYLEQLKKLSYKKDLEERKCSKVQAENSCGRSSSALVKKSKGMNGF